MNFVQEDLISYSRLAHIYCIFWMLWDFREKVVLIIRCAACKKKLWRYDKLGQGEVLRCHKSRIDKFYEASENAGRIYCACGKDIGIDKGTFYKMIAKAFTYSGTKRNK